MDIPSHFPNLISTRWLGAKHRKLEAGRRAGVRMVLFLSNYIIILMKVSKWEVKTSKIGGFNSLHTPALTQVTPQKRQEGMILTIIMKGGPSDGSTRKGCRQD